MSEVVTTPRVAGVHLNDSSNPGTPLGNSTPSALAASGTSAVSLSSALHVSVTSAGSSAVPLMEASSGQGSQDSYRSPSKWAAFDEDSEEPASPASARDGFQRMPSHGGSSVGLAQVDSASRHSSDTETKNLLEGDVLSVSESDALSISEGEDPYQITADQRQYYTDHFKTLLQATGREVDLVQGAIRGSDSQVQAFFQKSSLSRDSLCKIWQLADVNQDGWLNLDEFTVAMHLIVLHVKGNLLIPDFLPPHIAPRVTPPRGGLQSQPPGWTNFEGATGAATTTGGTGASSSQSEGGSSIAGGVSPSPHSREFTAEPPSGGAEKPIPQRRRASQSPEQLTPRPEVTAPTPPRRRTAATGGPVSPVPAATKAKTASLPLSPPSSLPKGPPPKPPPRPPHRSHGRSASLDLSKGPGLPGIKAAAAPPAHHPVSSPPSEPLPPAPLRDVGAQTEDFDEADVGLSRERHSPPPMMDLEAGEERPRRPSTTTTTAANPSAEGRSLQARVANLHASNAELEKERARLAQLRLQLEMQLQNLRSGK